MAEVKHVKAKVLLVGDEATKKAEPVAGVRGRNLHSIFYRSIEQRQRFVGGRP